MSRRVERCLLWGELIALLLVPMEGRCQDAAAAGQARTDAELTGPAAVRAVSEQEDSLVRAIEELLPRIEAASVRAAEIEAVIDAAEKERERQAVDTAAVSAWTVFASERDLEGAVDAFEKVAPAFFWAEGLPEPARQFTVARWSLIRPVLVDGMATRGVRARPWQGRGTLERKVGDALAHAVGGSLPAPVRVWTQNSPVRPSVTGLEQSRMFRELRMTPSLATRGCVAGDLEACRAALGLVPSPAAQAEAYEPAHLEAVVAYRTHRMAPTCAVATSEDGAGAGASPDERADCLAWWEDGSNWTQAIPLHGVTRANFLGFVLSRSGPTALEDFLRVWEAAVAVDAEAALEHDAAAPELVTAHLVPVLERVSGRPIDQLVSDFRDHIMGGRTERAAAPGTDGLGVLFWVLCAALLASRSTRWRLG